MDSGLFPKKYGSLFQKVRDMRQDKRLKTRPFSSEGRIKKSSPGGELQNSVKKGFKNQRGICEGSTPGGMPCGVVGASFTETIFMSNNKCSKGLISGVGGCAP